MNPFGKRNVSNFFVLLVICLNRLLINTAIWIKDIMAYTDKMYWEICTDETNVLMIEYNEFESIRVQNKDNWNNDGTSRGYMAYFC